MAKRITAAVTATAAAIATALVTSSTPAGAMADRAGSTATAVPAAATSAAQRSATTEYVLLLQPGATAAEARRAVVEAGGTLLRVDTAVGFAVARSSGAAFAAKADLAPAVEGVARNQVIGYAPKSARNADDAVERLQAERNRSRGQETTAAPAAAPAEPLANRQWDMRQIGATPYGSYAEQPGRRGVLVGVIDTGIDGNHPDIAPNFDRRQSVNFVVDNPLIDGTCEHPSCVDPVDEDDDGHGTHVASTIGAPINGIGIAGVAPNVRLVNIRAGQDSGYFFLAPTLLALTYAGQIGVDVVNMSFYTDPWLYNCLNNPADSPAEQTEQRVIRILTQRAVSYALHHGVLPVAAMGNEATDLGHPTFDDSSPDFPPGTEHDRDVNNSCITVPTETRGVEAVSSTGITTRLAYYSNYGTEQTDIAAPGGDYYDSPDNTGDPRNLVLAAYPANVAEASGDLNPDGTPNTPFVVQDCENNTCAYYQYLQGTSMASPHAVGVAALVVSEYGKRDPRHGGLTLNPERTRRILENSAVPHACPQPRTFHWTRITGSGAVIQSEATCRGGIRDNGFYGPGIVNAYSAVTR